MNKIPTLYLRDDSLGSIRRLTREINPACAWVLDGGVATRKYDGTCVLHDENGLWWARREVKPGKPFPPEYIPVEADAVSGKTMGWEPIGNSPFSKFWMEAVGLAEAARVSQVGTYELCGPKINGNPEQLGRHTLIRHADAEVLSNVPIAFHELARWLVSHSRFEGVVWHHPDGRMAKIKRRDFR